MNYSMIRYMLGYVIKLEAFFLIPPCITALIYRERAGWSLFMVLLLCTVIGILMTIKKPKSRSIYTKEGFVIVALSWIVISLFGCLPFVISGSIKSFVDALFETVSGFTTTGASILTNVEAMPHSLLFWRSFTHWIGGMGVLVFLMAILPLSDGRNMHIMRAESPGPSVGKLLPHVKSTAKVLYIMYFVLTILHFIALLIGKMPVFDAITTAFGTAGTGGFGIKNDSLAGYSSYIQIVVTVFMILFGINFNLFFLVITNRARQAFKSTELRYYLAIIAISITLIVLNTHNMYASLSESIKHTSFTVGSIITTTGYATVDFDLWPQFSKNILILLMFCGACAGSTGGGIKVSRMIIFVKTVKAELELLIHPKMISKSKMDGKPMDRELGKSVCTFLVAYALIYIISVFVISIDNFSFTTNFTAVAATINNIGPGLEAVGPTQNYSAFSDISKLVLVFDMLVGRLEVYPMLLLFLPSTWKK